MSCSRPIIGLYGGGYLVGDRAFALLNLDTPKDHDSCGRRSRRTGLHFPGRSVWVLGRCLDSGSERESRLFSNVPSRGDGGRGLEWNWLPVWHGSPTAMDRESA